jgi:GNAT superfamily N-acetyltransferase
MATWSLAMTGSSSAPPTVDAPVPEARGRGYARALVCRAEELARATGHDLIFIVADDRDWPKLLYRRLGFAQVGRIWQFHRG